LTKKFKIAQKAKGGRNMRKWKLVGIAVLLTVAAFVAMGCAMRHVPSAVEETEAVVVVPYDNTALGWWIEPHWVGGVWVPGFWTMENVVVHEYWPWYRGHYRDHFGRYFNHYGWRGHHDSPRHHRPDKKHHQGIHRQKREQRDHKIDRQRQRQPRQKPQRQQPRRQEKK